MHLKNTYCGKISNIFICASANEKLESVTTAHLISGKGIVGDRYYYETGTFSEKLAGNPAREITLIESEEINNFNMKFGFTFSYADFRRNIVTTGINLNNLVGKEFRIGAITLHGIRLCEPCAHLQGVLIDEVLPGLIGKGGLRASILENGEISVGDHILGNSI